MDAKADVVDANSAIAVEPVVETSGELFAAVYQRLKAMAARQLSRLPPGSTLETTALVHELYLRLERDLLKRSVAFWVKETSTR